jgi:hypothetical protein
MTPNKYGAVKTELDGYIFDSKAEAARYRALILLEKAGQIECLIVHPVFPFIHDGKTICKYEADFSYYEDERRIIEDVKGVKTAVYKLKKKMMKIFYNIDILETA